jgi:hypothetical protein
VRSSAMANKGSEAETCIVCLGDLPSRDKIQAAAIESSPASDSLDELVANVILASVRRLFLHLLSPLLMSTSGACFTVRPCLAL